MSWWQARLAPREVSGAAFFGAWTPAHELIGTAGLLFESRRKTLHTASLVGMFVAAAHAGHGVGGALLTACTDCARADPRLDFVYLTVTSGNAGAIRLYERAGFRVYGCEPGSMKLDGRAYDKLMMALALRPGTPQGP